MNIPIRRPFDHPPAPRWRSGLIAFTVSCCLGTALSTHAAPPAGPDPALVRQAQAARQTMVQLARLREQASDTQAAADRVSATGRDTLIAWQDYQRADERTRTVLEQALDCLPVLRQRLDANSAALASRTQAVARSQAAVQAVAQTEADGLAPVARRADAAFEQRLAAEKAFADEHRAVNEQANVCAGHTRSAQQAVASTQERAQDFVDQAREVAPQTAALRGRWQTTSAAFAAARQARLLATDNVVVTDASGEPLERLTQALAGTGLAARSGIRRLEPVGPLTPGRQNLERLSIELERLQDATAYIDLSTTSPSGDCSDAHCAGLLAERRALADRISDTRARMAQAVDQWQQAPAALNERLTPLASARQGLNDRLRALDSALGPAVTETVAFSQAVRAAATQLESTADLAHERARLAWEQAYQQAYGHPPEPDHSVSMASMAMSSSAAAPAAASMALDIRSHAYELFSQFDGEIGDFGAYTYVLVRSASDLQTPAVRQRFQQLLRILQTLPAAALVASGDKPHVNVFCVPVTPGHENARDASEVAYASDLGHQLKMRAQNGLLTQKAVRQRLTSAPGPFLITVPGRLARATSGSPVLLADLSTYPPDAIADLTHHYMNGLVDDFPRQQALWTPPVLQRVALFMIHLAEDTGQLVTSALPTAQAQPR